VTDAELRAPVSQLAVLSRLADCAGEAESVETLLAGALQELCALIGGDVALALLVDEDARRLRLAAGRRLPASVAGELNAVPPRPDQGVFGDVLGSGRLAVVDRGSGDVRAVGPALFALGVEQFIVLPLRAARRPLGVIVLGGKGDVPLGPRLTLLQTIASQLGLFVDGVRRRGDDHRRGAASDGGDRCGRAGDKARRLRLVNRLALVLTAARDEQAVFDAVVRTAVQLFGDVAATLWVGGPDTEPRLVAAAGFRRPERRRQGALPGAEGVAGRCAGVRRPVLVAHEAGATCDAALARAEGFQTAVSAPLMFGDRRSGVLVVHGRSREPVGVEDLDLLTTVANYAAFALENTRVRESARRRRAAQVSAERLAALGSVTRLLLSAAGSGEVHAAVARAATTLLGARLTRLWLCDHEAGVLRLAATCASDPACALPGLEMTTLPIGRGVGGEVVETLRPQYIPEILDDPRFLNRRLVETGHFHSLAAIPLVSAGRGVGALMTFFGERRDFSVEDEDLMRLLADQAAIAIEKSRLYESLRQKNEQLQEMVEIARTRAARMNRLHELSQLVNSSLDLQQVLDFVAAAARELLRGDSARLCVTDVHDPDVLRLTAESGGVALAVKQNREFRRGVGVAGWVMEHKRSYYSADLRTDSLFTNREWARAGGYVSMLMAPMLVGDRVVGTVAVMTRAPRVFSDDERGLLELFGAKAATAIHNARLYADVQAQTAALQAKNAELDSFVYVVSHDLKSPLVAIQGMASMIAADHADRLDERGRRYLERISANVAQMERLIADLLALSRVGREARRPERIAVNEIVDDVLAELADTIRSRGVKVTCGDLGCVVGIRTQLVQVWTNLVSNAVKYLGDQPEPVVEISATDRGDVVEYRVRDNGIGIDAAYHARIFELFQRLQDVDAEGSGVGLPIVKKIVEAAGGRVWVESVKGAGATFSFTWPKSSAASA
jgi:GAF domain-containing protein